jgi:hypothetical protein
VRPADDSLVGLIFLYVRSYRKRLTTKPR